MSVRHVWLFLAVTTCCDGPASTPAVRSAAPPNTAAPTAPPPTTAPQAAAPAVASVLGDPRRFDCTADGDCVNSCAYGAVSSGWYARAQGDPGFSECEDGCSNQISEPPRCEAGGCVAYQHDPQDEAKTSPRPDCTRVER
jgi:hypothetical protein